MNGDVHGQSIHQLIGAILRVNRLAGFFSPTSVAAASAWLGDDRARTDSVVGGSNRQYRSLARDARGAVVSHVASQTLFERSPRHSVCCAASSRAVV